MRLSCVLFKLLILFFSLHASKTNELSKTKMQLFKKKKSFFVIQNDLVLSVNQ